MVGARVRLARLSRKVKMTQAQLAVKLQLEDWEIDRGNVAKIEVGIREVTDIELYKLSKVLGVPIPWFFEDVE